MVLFGRTGMYKAFMFGSPSVIVTTPETCRRVLTVDDDSFKPGWPQSTVQLIGNKSFIGISYEEHKRLRLLTAALVNGYEALSTYAKYIEENVVSSLNKWTTMGEFEFLTQLRKLTFRIIMYIFLSSESEPVMEALEREYTALNYGVRAMAINLPGFSYHKALKARKKLVATFQSIVDERRNQRKEFVLPKKKDMMDALLDVADENGRKLSDEEIIDILLMYLNAGHESSGHTAMWAAIFLEWHPEFLQKAKAQNNCLLVDNRVRRAGIPLASKCDCCDNGGYEDQSHVLALGTFAEQVWSKCCSTLAICRMEGRNWKDKVEIWFRRAKFSTQPGQLIGLLPRIITWKLWTRWCMARMEGKHESLLSVWNSIKYWLGLIGKNLKASSRLSKRDEEILLMFNIPIKHKHISYLPSKWVKPKEGWHKLNVDGCSLGNPGSSGAGGAIRDCKGKLISGFNSYWESI
ncbi:ent-kaurenoic acid oxidase 1-like [Carya illinoinensis]|uniref:ent-kaurenoic acid oxidase 1-like n=1 Tax=Carya illinoinensis TaxID=32201 RepID=UPI001C723491|nr:ent-kaurenoic acid oxidase 1-like [Carya illinoinensis]